MYDRIADNHDASPPAPHDASARRSRPRSTQDEAIGSIPGIPGTSIDLDEEIAAAMTGALAETNGWTRPDDPS